jgi:hypothetical protein
MLFATKFVVQPFRSCRNLFRKSVILIFFQKLNNIKFIKFDESRVLTFMVH